MTSFKVGDWVIATQPIITSGIGLSLFGNSESIDRGYMDYPSEIKHITEGHVVLLPKRHGKISESLEPMCEFNKRKFIIADEYIKNMFKENDNG